MLWEINKEVTSPSLKFVRFSSLQKFVEIFCTNLQNLAWSSHIGVPLLYTNMAAAKQSVQLGSWWISASYEQECRALFQSLIQLFAHIEKVQKKKTVLVKGFPLLANNFKNLQFHNFPGSSWPRQRFSYLGLAFCHLTSVLYFRGHL